MSATESPAAAFSGVRLLTVPEVAAILRLSRMTVYRMVKDGGLEAIKVGRSVRIPEQVLRDYLATAGLALQAQQEQD